MHTLKDYLDFNLDILSIGLNPSTISVERGYYFANPRNRFWKALNASDMLLEELDPSTKSQDTLFSEYKIGFTDVVKRPSSMGKDLRAEDYKKWAPVLKREIEKYNPKICWFHGKVAMQKYLKYSDSKQFTVNWGKQEFKIKDSVVFVTPNPSPANAAFSLDVITDWYVELHNLLRQEL